MVNVTAFGANEEKVTGLCLDPHDLFISKLAAGREKDIEFVQTMIEHRMVDHDRVLELAATVPNSLEDKGRSLRIVARIKGLYATVSEHQLTHINVANGRYLGNIVGISDTVMQQMTTGDDIIFHQSNQIDRVPALGDLCTVQYQGGRANVVTHKSQAQEAARQQDAAMKGAPTTLGVDSAQDVADSRAEIKLPS